MAETAGMGKIGFLFHPACGPGLLTGGILTTAEIPESTRPRRESAFSTIS